MNKPEEYYCRLCAQLKSQKKLINLKPNQKKCHEIINKLTQLNLEMDFNENILPQTVCLTCLNSLDCAFDFITAVQEAQITLKNLILAQKIKKEQSESDSEYITYEPPLDDVEIKEEKGDLEVCNSKSSKNIEKKNKNICNSLDALPLSQINLTWSDYSWLCSYCDTQFPNLEELRTHSMQYHNTCTPYRCTDCRVRKLRLDKFLMHVKRHRKYLKFSCYKCPAKFKSILEGIKHNATHLNSDYICFGCNTTFLNKDELINHTNMYYNEKWGRPAPFKTEGLTCSICNKTYKTKISLKTHLLIHTDRKRDHTCETCGKCFFQKVTLEDHIRTLHSDDRPYECEICKATFKTQRRLRKHVGVHDGDKPFACDQCGRCFRLKYQLNNHSIIHTDLLPHVCSYCNKSFRFRTILNQHVRQHTGVKPYSCSICQRDFTNWPNYNKHMKRKHDMNMAKKKHTPDGLYPIDSATGEVKFPDRDKIQEFKKKIIGSKAAGARRPRISKKNDVVLECKENNDIERNNN